jgi:hypothetical protein
MYDVAQEEPSETFKRAWQAAGRHIGPLGGDSFNWLRATLNPPMAEHLSFRLGNQIFFVWVDAAEFVYENGKGLFLKVSQEANAIPCIMPMTERLTKFESSMPGWGLIHAETREPVNPPDLVSDELIQMTDWELHDFAIQMVKSKLSEEGKNVFSAQSSREIDPSIWYEEDGDAHWVVVRARRHPELQATAPANMEDIAEGCSRMGKAGFFASVVVANHDDPFDPEAATNGNYLPLYRGHGMSVNYEGLQKI